MTDKNCPLKQKALSLFSGGLDSILATKLMLEQGIPVEAIYFHNPFCDCDSPGSSCRSAQKTAALLGVPFSKIELDEEFLDMVRHPAHGYGSHMNPCIDCRILEFKKAKELMKKFNASFIFTGEVLNERPMSQRPNTMRMIDKAAGLEGLVVRPLSAKVMKETLPEQEGWVDREKLLDIQGRSRKKQMELAIKYKIGEYPTPSGGCLLTYEGYSQKVRDLIKYDQLDLEQARLLKTGRHFRLSATAKLIVGKDDNDNKKLLGLKPDKAIFLHAKDFPSPVGMLIGQHIDRPVIELAASVIAGYITKAKEASYVKISCKEPGHAGTSTIEAKKLSRDEMDSLRITK